MKMAHGPHVRTLKGHFKAAYKISECSSKEVINKTASKISSHTANLFHSLLKVVFNSSQRTLR